MARLDQLTVDTINTGVMISFSQAKSSHSPVDLSFTVRLGEFNRVDSLEVWFHIWLINIP